MFLLFVFLKWPNFNYQPYRPAPSSSSLPPTPLNQNPFLVSKIQSNVCDEWRDDLQVGTDDVDSESASHEDVTMEPPREDRPKKKKKRKKQKKRKKGKKSSDLLKEMGDDIRQQFTDLRAQFQDDGDPQASSLVAASNQEQDQVDGGQGDQQGAASKHGHHAAKEKGGGQKHHKEAHKKKGER
ncbi:bromodomain-containing protein 4-like isoform X1 [Frankliniella occidentalis]|uniref:Bromodomain-containing protein 4-like isoform X1 n=2 Tax=Frankliniella occidentalis TaxID=133901 RepID=A0A9C6U0B4_FRAOC|nr:bromodomain-containing protein 4-like isoform X1 [Frankliniella occidentalis]